MKKGYLLFIFLLSVHIITYSQVSNYTFKAGKSADPLLVAATCPLPTSSQQLMQPPNLPSVSTSPGQMGYCYAGGCQGSNAETVIGPGFPIGFDFVYDGQVFDQFAVSANGYIKLGHSGEDIVMYNDTLEGGVFQAGNDSFRANVIAVLQNNLPVYTQGIIMGGEVSFNNVIQTFPGNKVLLISWIYSSGYTPPIQFSGVSLYLKENGNTIEIIYSSCSYNNSSIAPAKVAVGLRGGALNNEMSNLNIRQVVTGVNAWDSSVAGTAATDLCDFGPASLPTASLPTPNNLSYTWTPPASPAPPVCPDIYLTSANINGSNDSIPSGYVYGGQSGVGVAVSNVYWKLADGTINVPRNPTLYWSSDNSNPVPTTYDVYFGTDNPPVTMVSQNQSDTSYTPAYPYLAPNTTYYYKVIARNTYGMSPGCTGSFTTGALQNYCGLVQGGTMASSISLNTLSFSQSAYTIATDVRRMPAVPPYITTLKRDSTYKFHITILPANVLLPGIDWADCSCYIDWNQDGDFDDAGEAYPMGSLGLGASDSLSIPVPNTAVLGNTVMRVTSGGYGAGVNAPCNSYYYAIDFVLTIAPTTACAGFSINPVVNDVSCFGDSTGSINLSPSGGVAPYTVVWTDGKAANEYVRTGLGRGTYQVASMTDAHGCEVSTQLMAVLQPGALCIDTSTVNNATTVSISGGTAPYSYLWSNGSTFINPSNLSPGIYSLTVSDVNGCDSTMDDILIRNASTTGVVVASVEEGLVVYPNPTTGLVYLKSKTTQVLHVQVVSSQGLVMEEGDYSSNVSPLDLSSYAQGLYFIKITSNQASSIVKVVKE